MNKLVKSVLLAVSISATGAYASVSDPGFDKGHEAYSSGDYKTAIKEWTPLAEKGNARLQFMLGFMYAKGRGVLENDQTAVKWFTLAAEQGDAYAQSSLGIMYNNGEGVLKDTKRAYMWYNIGAYSGNEFGAEDRDNLAEYMTLEQIDKAQDMSRICFESGYTDC